MSEMFTTSVNISVISELKSKWEVWLFNNLSNPIAGWLPLITSSIFDLGRHQISSEGSYKYSLWIILVNSYTSVDLIFNTRYIGRPILRG